MEWDDLRHFLAVARSGTLAGAAHTLETSPATIGRRISALEARLGARLFHRSQTGYCLTESGVTIRIKAEEIENTVLQVERQALGRDLHPSGKVRVTAADEIAAQVMAPHLREFRERYPDIILEVVGDANLANLTRREADIALRTVRPKQGGLVIRHVGWWKCGLYAAKSYADAHKLRPGLSKYSNLGIITWTKERSHLRGGPWFAKHARDSAIVFQASSRRLQYGACKAGMGLAILPCLLADQDPELIQLLSPESVIADPLYFLVHRDVTRTARVRAVIDFFCERISRYTR